MAKALAILTTAYSAQALQLQQATSGNADTNESSNVSYRVAVGGAGGSNECITFRVGTSWHSRTKTVTLPIDVDCPLTVTKANWEGTDTWGDVFQITQAGRSVTVARVDAEAIAKDIGWGMDLAFKCCGECVTLHVGSSNSRSKSATLTSDPSENYVCPTFVNKDIWLGGATYGDKFGVSQNGADITVTRQDNDHWGMGLQFPCCKSPSQPAPTKLPICLFLHGAMVKGPWPPRFVTWHGDVAGALRTYWGPYNTWFADYCNEFLYVNADTETHAWNDATLQQAYADEAEKVINRGGVVFAHSMANAILAGACWQRGKCVQWYSLGGGYSGQAVGNGVSAVMGALAVAGVNNVMNMNVYEGFNFAAHGMRHDPNADSRNAMAKVVDSKSLLKGSVCGVKPEGGAWQDSTSMPDWGLDFPTVIENQNYWDQHVMGVGMLAANAIVETTLKDKGETDTRNDGLVEVAACAYWEDENGRHWYGTGTEWPTVGPTDDPDDTHILAEINHIEECGVFPQTTVAMNWMQNMMCRELKSQGKECPAKTTSFDFLPPNRQIGDACDIGFNGCNEGTCCEVSDALHMMCQHKQTDWAGLQWCPKHCQGAFGFPGTCENEEFTTMAHGPRPLGAPCLLDWDCDGWISWTPTGCCNKVCTKKEPDWLGVHYCPGSNWR